MIAPTVVWIAQTNPLALSWQMTEGPMLIYSLLP
jgi:hypothetical protein